MKKYESIKPIEKPIPADRQGAKRHYGVHPYFTRRPFNVVRDYIERFTQEGDRVLDPFGGSGVTAIEAFLNNRSGIHNDINPLANFIAKGIAELAKGEAASYAMALETIRDRCERRIRALDEMTETEVSQTLKRLHLPDNVALPTNSDVDHFYDLFSPKQLAALAVLREAIDDIDNHCARNAMRLAWSASLTKLNRTFLSAEGRAESRGGSSIFSIYRYKVAARPVELPPWPTFQERAMNVLAAKEEIDTVVAYHKQTRGFSGTFEIHEGDIKALATSIEPVDYIFTDPPYGAHISYLDLSTLWNVWNGSFPSRKSRELELIVGGDLSHSEDAYVQRLRESIEICFALLKPDRWLSVVFQHWSPAYFDAILSGAAAVGGDLRAAISQIGDPIWSMHKKKNRESVLAGEMILTFLKTGKPKRVKVSRTFDLRPEIRRILRETHDAIYGEYLFNRIIIDAWNAGALASLDISKTAFVEHMNEEGWFYDEMSHQWRRAEAPRSRPTLFAGH